MQDVWVKVYRKIWKNPIARKPDYLAVWLFLMTNACHRKRTVQVINRTINLKKGMLVCSLRKIGDFFGMPASKVKYIIDYMVDEKMVEVESTEHYTIFTILKFEEYQKGKASPGEKVHYADNVVMTNRQYNFLLAKHGKNLVEDAVIFLSKYKYKHNRSFDSDFHAMNSWVINATKKGAKRGRGNRKDIKPGSDKRVLESWFSRKKV